MANEVKNLEDWKNKVLNGLSREELVLRIEENTLLK